MYTSGPPPPVWQKTIFFPDFFFATLPKTFKHKFNISLFQPVKASSQSMPRMPQTEKGKSGKGGNGKKVRGLLFGFLEKLGTLYQPPWIGGWDTKIKKNDVYFTFQAILSISFFPPRPFQCKHLKGHSGPRVSSAQRIGFFNVGLGIGQNTG